MMATAAAPAAPSAAASPPVATRMSNSYARRDGRTALEIRGKEMKLSDITEMDGSSWYAQGQTAVTVAIHGPTMAKNEEYDTCAVRVRVQHVRGLAPSAGGAEKSMYEEKKRDLLTRTDALALESLLESGLHGTFMHERFPRCVLVVDVVVVQDDGSLPAVAVNAVMCALLDAGLPCRTTMAAVCVAAVNFDADPHSVEFLLDPTGVEEALGVDLAVGGGSPAALPLLDETRNTAGGGGDALPTQPIAKVTLVGPSVSHGVYRCMATAVFVFSNPSCGGGLLAQLVRSVGGRTAEPSPKTVGLSVQTFAEMMALGERASAVLFDFFRQCNVAA